VRDDLIDDSAVRSRGIQLFEIFFRADVLIDAEEVFERLTEA
jgi:hypothetical protein